MRDQTKAAYRSKTLFWIVFVFYLSIHTILIASIRLYPFLDTPNHLAMATIYRYYGQTANHFSDYYLIETILKPNVFHLFFCGTKLFPSVEFANKVFYCFYVLLFPIAVLLVIRRLNGNPWFGLLSFLYLYNYSVTFGFAGFTIAIPFIFLLFYFYLDYLECARAFNTAMIAGLLLLIFFMHALAALFSLLLFFACCLYENRHSLGTFVKKSAVTVPALLLIFYWWTGDSRKFGEESLFNSLIAYYRDEYFSTFLMRGELLFYDNYTLYGGIPGYVIGSFFSLVLIALTLFFWWSRNKGPLLSDKQKKHIVYAGIFVVCASLCFLFMPFKLPGYSFLFERFSALFFVALIVAGSLLGHMKIQRRMKVAVCLLCLMHFILWADYYRDFEHENRSFTEDFFPAGAQGKKMGGLIYDCEFRKRHIYENFTDYYIAWKQGIATTRVIDDRSFPVIRKAEKDLLPKYLGWISKHHNEYTGNYASMDYILVRGNLPDRVKQYFVNFRLMKSNGKWLLYERKT